MIIARSLRNTYALNFQAKFPPGLLTLKMTKHAYRQRCNKEPVATALSSSCSDFLAHQHEVTEFGKQHRRMDLINNDLT